MSCENSWETELNGHIAPEPSVLGTEQACQYLEILELENTVHMVVSV